MASLQASLSPRHIAATLVFAAIVGSAACGDATSPEQLEFSGPPHVEGPLTLEINAPDSSVTQRLLFPDFTYGYVCTLTLLASLSGGERDSVIYWQSADVTWHWLSNNEFRHATVWPMEQLEVFWGSDQLVTGRSRESIVWQFTGSMPYRLDFAFHYLLQGEDSVRTEDSAVRCVGPPG